MRIGKSRYIESNRTHCCTEKFNAALSLCGVLEVASYFSEGFSEAAARVSVVAEALWPLDETIVTSKSYSASATADIPTVTSKKPSEK